jgi:diguanylate cyclase (GGDEF)-like protein
MIRSAAAVRAALVELGCSVDSTVRGLTGCSLVLGLLVLLSGFSAWLQAADAKFAAPNSRMPLILDQPDGLPRSLFPFQSYGADAGLDNLAIRRIAQDKPGFLWVGTEDGLYRYDGGRFTRFDSSNGLPSTWITDLLATPEGSLWVCTPQGLAVRNGEKFNTVHGESTGLPPGSCSAVTRDNRGVIWVAHKDGLFYQRGGRFHRIMGFPAGSASAIVSQHEPSNSVFAGARGIVIRIDDYRIKAKYTIGTDPAETVDSLAADNAGKIWAQCARRLFCLPPDSPQFHDESAGIPTISSRGVLSTDRGGRLWVPTDEGMSCRIGERWHNFGLKNGLPIDWARYIFEDREGSLWIGSLGIHRLVGRGAWMSWTRSDGLPSDTIWSIYRTHRGELWVATDKGLCLATPTGWQTLPGTEKTVVRQIHEDQKGRLWLSLVPAGILRYDPATRQSLRYEGTLGVKGKRVLCIEEDSKGQLWVATDGAGLLRYRAANNDFVPEIVPSGTPEETFRYLLRDKKGRLWATGEHGLLVMSDGKWRRFDHKDGLLQDHVSYMTELDSGEFWLAYFEPLGIARFTLNGEKLKLLEHLNKKNGLSSEKVYLLGEGLNGELWVGTGKGIDIISRDGVLHFSKADGLASDDIDAMAFLVEPNGSVFVGTSSGLSMYRSDSEAELAQSPKPVFLSASIGDRALSPTGGKIPKFPHECNTLKVEIAVLSFLHESQIQYSVRLKGLETEWHNSRTRDARYPGLPPGAYVYEVRARLGSAAWSSPVSLAFEIQEPWWRTRSAIAAWLLLIASAAFAAFRWRLEHLRKRTRQLESLVSARTMELAMANTDLERLSITDPLTGLKNRRFLEFSIVEDLARIRRTLQPMHLDSISTREEMPNITFLVIDIDHFKLVNDRYGHAAGDQVLRKTGAVLSSAVRESDTTVRWGGEEFLIIARNPKGCDSAALAERIRKQLESASFSITNDQTIRLTCSIGFASWPFFRHEPDAFGWEDVLGLADRCLYLAKNSGRNAWFGLAARWDYRGTTDCSVLNDLRAAESSGIVDIQSSASTPVKPRPYQQRPRHTVETIFG